MTRQHSLRYRGAILALAAASWMASVRAETLFSDNFDSDTSAAWDVRVGSFNAGDTDYKVEWAFDYGQQTFNLFADALDTTGQSLTVPSAPNSNGTTKGVKLTVNKDDLGARIVVNLYPRNQSFSGNYVLKFDMFMNHGSWGDIGGNTTENAWFGINHTGAGANWAVFAGNGLSSAFAAPIAGADKSDGLFFTVTCDGGGAKDLWALAGNAGGPPSVLFGDAGGILDLDGDTVPDHGDEQGNFTGTFTSPPFEAPGIISKRWIPVEVSQVDNVVTMKLNGQVFSRYTNSTPWKAGTVMLGYADIFNSISTLLEENWVLFDNIRVERVRKVVVDTADNDSTAGDGKTSLLEALQGLQDNDHITFNIPGAGPHVIKTPLGGYPLITKPGVVIDGYTQPGAAANSRGILEGNNAQLKIVLDSSGTDAGPGTLPSRRSTRLPFPGYGDSENAILGIYEADDVTVRGLSFRSRHTPGSDEDPSIYCIALVKQAERCKVQGNWFGLDPDGKTTSGSASAVAAFRHRVSVNGANVDTFSGQLTFGTDSDGRNDAGEFNIATGMHIALAMELPYARTSGNYFNVLADGTTFVAPDTIYQAQLDSGRDGGDSSVENYENGRNTVGSVIGTDGNGVNDANERNVFGQVTYNHLIEFYSNANSVKIAGNYFGVGVDGTTVAPPSDLRPTPNLISVPGTASVVVGSNGDRKSDALEGNVIRSIGGAKFIAASAASLVAARGNSIQGSGFDGFPFPEGSPAWDAYYADAVVDPTSVQSVVTGFANDEVSGTIAAPKGDPYAFHVIDIYLADPASPNPASPAPGTWVASGREGQEGEDLDAEANKFRFKVPSGSVPGGSGLVALVTYSKDFADFGNGVTATVANPGRAITGPAGAAFTVAGGAPISGVKATLDAGAVKITVTGGTPPFQLQRRSALGGTWSNEGAPFSGPTATVPATGGEGYFRVVGQ
jgi:hypothetical protein